MLLGLLYLEAKEDNSDFKLCTISRQEPGHLKGSGDAQGYKGVLSHSPLSHKVGTDPAKKLSILTHQLVGY
jgi:hypothetical protein